MIIAQRLTKVFTRKRLGLSSPWLGPKGHALKKGSIVAVDAVDLEIPAGMVFGLLGANGAGKTTLLKLLSTLVIPTSGSAIINGYDLGTQGRNVRASIGMSLGGERCFYWRLTGAQNLEFFGAMQGLGGSELKKRISRLLDELELGYSKDVPVMMYTTGMKRKLDLARALLTDPPVLLLDELTSAVDPGAAARIREMVQGLRQRGKAVLLVTHNLAEAELLCDLIGIMSQGKLMAVGDSPSLRSLIRGCKIRIRLGGGEDQFLQALTSLDGINDIRREGSEVTVLAGHGDGIINSIIEAIVAANLPVQDINVDRPSLEDVFFYLTRGNENACNHGLGQKRVPHLEELSDSHGVEFG